MFLEVSGFTQLRCKLQGHADGALGTPIGTRPYSRVFALRIKLYQETDHKLSIDAMLPKTFTRGSSVVTQQREREMFRTDRSRSHADRFGQSNGENSLCSFGC